ncbi:MAG: glycosyltransferase family 4 protein [Planctomycetes bacterium]|nr:glycosyltransferase family 4 protein [Planctomycetota bacterium]
MLVVTTRWDLVGGSERYAGDVVRALRERGVEVPVLCAEGEQEGAAQVLRFEALAAERLSRAERVALRDLVRAARPDVVYLLSRARADALRVLLDAAPVVRFVQDHTLFCPGLNKLHEDGAPCAAPLGLACLERYWTGAGCSGFKPTGAPALRWPLRTLAANLGELERTKRCRRVFVASHYMRDELVRAGLAPDLVRVLPYFTSAQRPSPAPLAAATRAFLERDARPLLLCAARLVLPDKGVDYLLTALGHLAQRAKLVVAGDGPARAWLEEKARAEGLADDLHVTGWLAPFELEALFAASDVVVFPSVWDEPFGLVGLEAMAHAKPVVAFDVGGVREWLTEDVTGLLAPRRDAHALAQRIAGLLDDPVRAARLGAAGRERAARDFTAARHVDALLAEL